MIFNRIIGIFTLIVLLISCNDWDLDRIGFTRVITVGAIEVSAVSAFLIGDIEDIRASSIVESGFVISDVADTDQALRLGSPGVFPVLSPGMDTISEDRAFAARIRELKGSTNYFFRAYVRIQNEDEEIYGNIDEFLTKEINVSLLSVHRTSEGCPTTAVVTVEVDGASPAIEGTLGLVLSNNIDNPKPTIENGTLLFGEFVGSSGRIEFEIEVGCQESYFFQLVLDPATQPTYLESYAFTTIEGGLWSEKASFDGRLRKGKPVSFEINGRGYLIGGGRSTDPNTSQLFVYNVEENSWSSIREVDNLNISRAIVTVDDDKVYMTTGFTSLQNCSKTGFILARDNTLTTFTYDELCSDCPGNDCPWCGPLMLAGTGQGTSFYSCLCLSEGMSIFDLSNDAFEYIARAPMGRRIDALNFNIEGEYYVIGGESPTFDTPTGLEARARCINYLRNCTRSVQKFDPEVPADMDDFPGSLRFDQVGFTIKDRGYAGLGLFCTGDLIEGEYGGEFGPPFLSFQDVSFLTDFYEFDPTRNPGNQWESMPSFPADVLKDQPLFGFSLSAKGFVLFRNADSDLILWEFDPLGDSGVYWREIGNAPMIHDSPPVHLFNISNIAYIFFLERTNNLWMYVPEL